MRIRALPSRLRIGNDDLDSGQQFARLHETQAVRAALLHEGDAVVAKRAHIDVHGGGVGTRGALFVVVERYE